MEHQIIQVIGECASGSYAGTLSFPDVVQKLREVNIERYYADFMRAEITYYHQSGASHVEATEVAGEAVAQDFQSHEVVDAVRASQQDGQLYKDFVSRVVNAGCTGYFVYLDGKRVIYSGRKGDMHIEYFPGSQ